MIDQRRFRSTVPFYLTGRLPYPPDLIRSVAVTLRLDGRGRLLDLGCGPGFLAIGFAPFVAEVVAMDPEPRMLVAARDAANTKGVRLTFIRGGSMDLGSYLGSFSLVTMGRSFHWMDRERTLTVLDTLIEPFGSVALFCDRHPDCPENAWCKAWDAARKRFSMESRQGRAVGAESHEVMLRRSAFSTLSHLTHLYSRRTSVDELVDRALSTSSSSPDALGAARTTFEMELRAAVVPYARDGAIEELVEAQALLAMRPTTPGVVE